MCNGWLRLAEGSNYARQHGHQKALRRTQRPLIDREIAKFRRAEAGALSYMQGEIRITARPPSPLAAIRSAISDEALVRPSFAGRGTINLEASMGGYHTFEIAGESWILSKGAYWASEGGVRLGLHRERVWTSLWTGEGFIHYQTRVSGAGRVVLNAPGPAEEITLKDECLMVEGRLVLARRARLPATARDHAGPVVFRRRGPTARLCGDRQGTGVLDALLEPARHWCAGRPTGTSTSWR
jgi:uncharacterized protein (AIM24 family)